MASLWLCQTTARPNPKHGVTQHPIRLYGEYAARQFHVGLEMNMNDLLRYVRCCALFVCALGVTGCAILMEAAHSSHRQANAVAVGTTFSGPGFTFRVPESGLYTTYDFPTSGGVTLRGVSGLEQGRTLYVTPYVSPEAVTASAALDEWNEKPQKKGLTVTVLDRNETTLSGRPAVRATVDIPTRGDNGLISALLVVQRSTDFLILASGDRYLYPKDRGRVLRQTRESLRGLCESTNIEDASQPEN